jgi:hypothetical protein
MKLELRHLAPYLPYGLKAIDTQTKEIRRVTLLHFTYDLKTVGHNHLIYEGLILRKHKPILRPLSDLSNEDLEGEPIYFPSIKMVELIESNRDILGCDYSEVDYLIRNHFDVFGLIEKGLAININTI